MFFRKFPRFSGYSRPSSSTIRSALWENAHHSLAALGVLLATAGGALLPTVLSCSRDGLKRANIRKQWHGECQQTCFIMAPKTGPKKVVKTWLRYMDFGSPSAAHGCLCHSFWLLWSVNFWSSWRRSERHVATPKTGLPHAPTCRFGAHVFGLACLKIDIENSLGMALSKAKSGRAWQSHFWNCGTLQGCSRHEALRMTQVDQRFCLS